MGSTEIHDPAEETENPIQTDFTSLGDTPPSGDSGVHSLGEQWNNMSTTDMESEQNKRPTSGNQSGQRGGDTQVPPNIEEDEDIIDSSVNSGTDGGNSDIGVLAFFRTMKKSQRWNNSPVAEYPVVNVGRVSNIWNGAPTI